jgi:Ni,Fe-hydrogenase III small subunit/formate hydrogenlyase subunit 6/NADH:ubiquinone oxidoreductase subunit I
MLEWLARGLRKGRVTTRYPAGPEPAPVGFRGRIEILDSEAAADPELEAVCPTGAIAVGEEGAIRLDRGRCILCGACVRAAPDQFAFRAEYETAARRRSGLVIGAAVDAVNVEPLRQTLGERARALRRSIHIRHVDAGSDGAEEWEIAALLNPYYDIQRLGLFFTSAPRHADILLVTGGVTAPMRAPLERAWQVMPEPKAVVAVGTDACSGGLSAQGDRTLGGVDRVLPVNVYVPGSPPAPIAILHGLLLAVGVLAEEVA